MVLIGPNNSGKATVLQALALWTIGLQRWQEKRSERQNLLLRYSPSSHSPCSGLAGQSSPVG